MENNNYETIEIAVTYLNHGVLVKNIRPVMGEERLSDLVNKKIANLIKKEFAKNNKM